MTVTTILCDDGTVESADLPGVIAVKDLCRQPQQLADVPGELDRVVLALHHGKYALAELQKYLRLVDVDPLGVEIVEVAPIKGPDGDLQRRISGAAARAQAFLRSEPEQAKPVFPRSMSRRGFLSPTPEYLAVPSVDAGTCAAGDGCRACVAECPRDAYSVLNGRVVYDKEACEPCGRCVTVCPTGAIVNPVVTPEGVAAQIRAIVSFDEQPIGIAFVCSRGSARPADSGWFGVKVPCTGMLTVNWLLAPMLLGAARVVALPCSASGCHLEYDAVLVDRVDLVRRLLTEFGLDASLIGLAWREEPGPVSLPAIDLVDPFGIHGGAEVLLALASVATRQPTQTIEDRSSPCGLVEINTATCTMCSMCAQTCPTGALDQTTNENRLELRFDPALCVACAQCVPVCPELDRGAIHMRPAIDIGELALGSRVVNTAEVLVCERCGEPVAPAAMMDRIGALLGEEQAATLGYLKRRCMNCRGA